MDTVQMTRAGIEARTGRFAQLQPMEFLKDDTVVSQAAKDIILARIEKIVLDRWDTLSCPPGVHRGFRNVDVKDSVLLTIITGGINDRNDIGLPPAIATQIEAVDPDALEIFKTKMGLRFDAEAAV